MNLGVDDQIQHVVDQLIGRSTDFLFVDSWPAVPLQLYFTRLNVAENKKGKKNKSKVKEFNENDQNKLLNAPVGSLDEKMVSGDIADMQKVSERDDGNAVQQHEPSSMQISDNNNIGYNNHASSSLQKMVNSHSGTMSERHKSSAYQPMQHEDRQASHQQVNNDSNQNVVQSYSSTSQLEGEPTQPRRAKSMTSALQRQRSGPALSSKPINDSPQARQAGYSSINNLQGQSQEWPRLLSKSSQLEAQQHTALGVMQSLGLEGIAKHIAKKQGHIDNGDHFNKIQKQGQNVLVPSRQGSDFGGSLYGPSDGGSDDSTGDVHVHAHQLIDKSNASHLDGDTFDGQQGLSEAQQQEHGVSQRTVKVLQEKELQQLINVKWRAKDIDKMTYDEVVQEKHQLKHHLKAIDDMFIKCFHRQPLKRDKEALRHLYVRYYKLKKYLINQNETGLAQ